MKITEANAIVGGFSEPSKMPCYSWSIPARLCKAGAVMAAMLGTICHMCYALKGRYVFPVVQAALQRRYDALMMALAGPKYRAAFIAAFVRRLQGESHFRWFDSGDLQSMEHLQLIVDIAKATPDTMHWLPSREYALLRRYIGANHPEAVFPDNLCVRVSAMKPNEDAPRVKGLPSSRVHTTDAYTVYGFPCGAPDNGGKCGPCRACWDRFIPVVSYPSH